MLRNNARLRATVQYFNIQFANGKWYAWFYEPMGNEEAVNDITSN